MFKKLVFATLAAAVMTMAVPAHAQYCYRNYIQNSAFSSTSNWTFANGAYLDTTSDDPCDFIYGYRVSAAALFQPRSSVSQTFTTDSTAMLGWTMSFEVQAQSIAGANGWDEIKILVENLTTGQSEMFLVKGTQLTSTCQRFDFTLTKNYRNSTVRITFNSQPFTSLDFYIDNVAFFGQYC